MIDESFNGTMKRLFYLPPSSPFFSTGPCVRWVGSMNREESMLWPELSYRCARPLSQVCSTVDVVVSSYILYCSIFAVL